MDSDVGRRIGTTVREVLEESDMNNTTEYKVRKLASERLGMDLSQPKYKAIVRQVVESFLEEQKAREEQNAMGKEEGEEQEEQEEEEEETGKKSGGDAEYTEDGDLIICKLSEKRKVTMQEFRGKPLLSIREYFKKGGKEFPTSKGISLTEEQWSVLRKNVPAVEKAIKKLESNAM
ncbi:RNA polymerase II transcriptional coactivator KELP [Eucalyptus grandis]|uniref:RNA polymerase II transcriptional coactivator KELP n=1 Tax=Eucalyptus grandis TaxID=71139 RepID=UPI00192EFBA7|nr:RNA polymerase II transcriptional coactivator KELP [Eucalyptus grandis]XP_010055885.2 RNA polymerase II transcriptional coactivator KELP [Eucalyptus grandis]